MSTDQNPPPQPITQPAMAAVVMPSAATEARVAAVEAKLVSVAEDVATLKTEMTAQKSRGESTDKKVNTLEADVSDIKTSLVSLDESAQKRTETLERIEKLLKPFSGIVAHPKVQTALIALALAAIAALTAWLTSKGHVTP